MKPIVVYLHRYPIEIESQRYASARLIMDLLLPKYEVVYMSMKGRDPADPACRRGITMIELPMTIQPGNLFDKWFKTICWYLCLPYILMRLKKMHPALILCKEALPFINCFVGLLRKPMLIAVSDWWWSILLGEFPFGIKIADFLERCEVRLWNRADNRIVMANSRAEAGVVERLGMSPDRIQIVNSPLVQGVYGSCDSSEERRKLGFDGGTWAVAVHGIIRAGKGYEQLLEWWCRLAPAHPDWRLMIIGGAGGEGWCRNMIQRLGIEKQVVMTGWLPTHEDVNRYLNAADCQLVIRRNSKDNTGLIPSSLYHSMATGKPTIAVGLAGISEIIEHGKSGYLFEPDNYDSFLRTIEYVAAHREEADRVGAAGIQRAMECFDPEVSAAKHVELIDLLVESGV